MRRSHSAHTTTRVPPGPASVNVGDELAVDAHPAGGHVLLDPLVGQPGRGEPVAHGRRVGSSSVTPPTRLVTVNAEDMRGGAGSG